MCAIDVGIVCIFVLEVTNEQIFFYFMLKLCAFSLDKILKSIIGTANLCLFIQKKQWHCIWDSVFANHTIINATHCVCEMIDTHNMSIEFAASIVLSSTSIDDIQIKLQRINSHTYRSH